MKGRPRFSITSFDFRKTEHKKEDIHALNHWRMENSHKASKVQKKDFGSFQIKGKLTNFGYCLRLALQAESFFGLLLDFLHAVV